MPKKNARQGSQWNRSSLVYYKKQPIITSYEDRLLSKLLVERFLMVLTEKEKETIVLWSEGSTMKDIALVISIKYDRRTPDNPLGGRAMSARIKKILEKLRNYAIKQGISD